MRFSTARAAVAAALLAILDAHGAKADPRVQVVAYDSKAVIHVLTARGTATHLALPEGEAIRFVASGQGADCSKPEFAWCIAAEPGQNNVFVKPKAGAQTTTLSIVTDQHSYSFELEPLQEGSAQRATLRLVVRTAPFVQANHASGADDEALAGAHAILAERLAVEADRARLADRLLRAPDVVNASYSIARGAASEDIVPKAVYDDGRFTYLEFPGNRALPAVFQISEDNSESLVNTRMEGEQLVIDRVARRLMLRLGQGVVAVINDAFDADGQPAQDGTTAAGVERVLKTNFASNP